MNGTNTSGQPDNTAVRTALWRALHLQADGKPPIFEDEIGLKLIAPEEGWQERPDMKFTKRLRASIIARARFLEDIVVSKIREGVAQYVILGAGLDTFAERQPDIASKVHIYEIDQAPTLAWKEQRLIQLGFNIPGNLHFVPIDFETSSWWFQLLKAGFEPAKRAVIGCTGVTLYLTNDAIAATLHQVAGLAHGSTLVMTFYLPIHLLDEEDKSMQEIAEKGASAAGTPFISFFSPDQVLALAENAGFKDAKIISTKDLEGYYFKNRSDQLIPATGEIFLLATT